MPPYGSCAQGGLQQEDDRLRAELRRTQGGAGLSPGEDPASADARRGRHRRGALHRDPAAQLHRASRGGDQPHPEEARGALPRLPARRHHGRLRVPGRHGQGEGARRDRGGGQEPARHHAAAVGRDDRLHFRVHRGRHQEEEGQDPQDPRPHLGGCAHRAGAAGGRDPRQGEDRALRVHELREVDRFASDRPGRGASARHDHHADPPEERGPSHVPHETRAGDPPGGTGRPLPCAHARPHLRGGAPLQAHREGEDLRGRAGHGDRGVQAVPEGAAARCHAGGRGASAQDPDPAHFPVRHRQEPRRDPLRVEGRAVQEDPAAGQVLRR